VTKKLIENRYAELAQAEIDSVREMYEKRIARECEKENNTIRIVNTEALVEKKDFVHVDHERGLINPSKNLTRSSLEDNPYEKAKRNYNLVPKKEEVFDGEPEEDDEDEEEDDEPRDAAGYSEQDMMDLTKINRTMPYVIDDREFSEEFDHHDKISLYYYKLDDVLCEENEEIIQEIESTIGYDSLHVLDMQTTVWVRNEPLRIDYEIMALNKSYAETVMGIRSASAMSPRERYNQQKRREKDGME